MGDLAHAMAISGGGVISLVGAGGKTTLMFCLARELAASGASVLATTTTKVRVPGADDARQIIISSDVEDVLNRVQGAGVGGGVLFAVAREISSQGKLSGFQPSVIDSIAASGAFQWIVVEADGAAQRPVKAPAPHEPVIPESSGWVIGILGIDVIGKPLNESNVFRPERFASITGLSMENPISAASLAKVLAHPEGILKGCPKEAAAVAFLNKADTSEVVSNGRKVVAFLREMKCSLLRRILIGKLLPNPEIHEYHNI